MIDNEINRADSRLYRKLIGLSRKQLAAIHARLADNIKRKRDFWFWIRNIRIKRFISSLLRKKQARIGEDAPREMMDDLKQIEMNHKDWPNVGKEELDYILIMLHGVRDMSEFESHKPWVREQP